MAIQSNFEYKGIKYPEVVFKIVRVFGSKKEGWNAVFGFVPTTEEFEEKNYKGLITVGTVWEDVNPYPVLYKKMESIIENGGFVITREVVEVIPTAYEHEVVAPVETPEKEVVPEKPRKPKTIKKAKTDGKSTTDN
jgi:hypothetical protein